MGLGGVPQPPTEQQRSEVDELSTLTGVRAKKIASERLMAKEIARLRGLSYLGVQVERLERLETSMRRAGRGPYLDVLMPINRDDLRKVNQRLLALESLESAETSIIEQRSKAAIEEDRRRVDVQVAREEQARKAADEHRRQQRRRRLERPTFSELERREREKQWRLIAVRWSTHCWSCGKELRGKKSAAYRASTKTVVCVRCCRTKMGAEPIPSRAYLEGKKPKARNALVTFVDAPARSTVPSQQAARAEQLLSRGPRAKG